MPIRTQEPYPSAARRDPRLKAAGASRPSCGGRIIFLQECDTTKMMSHIDCWATLAEMAGATPPPHDWVDNDGKGIYFDSIDNSAYILGKSPHSARKSWIYIDGEVFQGARADIGGDPNAPWVHIA